MSAAKAYFKGKIELSVAAFFAALGLALAIGSFNLDVAGSETIGPQFFPFMVAGLLFLVGIALAVQVVMRRGAPARSDDAVPTSEFSTDMLEDLAGTHHHPGSVARSPEPAVTSADARATTKTPEPATHTDWKTVGMIVAGIAAFALLLKIVGFVLAATGLFWVVCRALGSQRAIFDIAVAVIVASVLQLAFGLGLGLALPSGFFGIIFGGGE